MFSREDAAQVHRSVGRAGEFMRRVAYVLVGCAGWLAGVAPAATDHAPSIVIPGKPGIPVIINGYDASYTVVEGDWGLYRPGAVPVRIISGPRVVPQPYRGPQYFPADGQTPGLGRVERNPPANRQAPRPAQSYHRSWETSSDPLPATIDPPTDTPLLISPEINLGPNDGRRPRPRPIPHRR
jgi:hypothetical protein